LTIGLIRIRINKSLFYSFAAFTAHSLQQEPHLKMAKTYVDAIDEFRGGGGGQRNRRPLDFDWGLHRLAAAAVPGTRSYTI